MNAARGVEMDWSDQTDADILRLYASLMAELRTRGVVRSSNNPVADYTESLVAQRLGLKLLGNSAAGCDATDAAGVRYQIKGRRLTPQGSSTQLSAIRNLETRPFDVLAAVVYNADFSIAYAAVIPHEFVLAHARYRKHTNSHCFMMTRAVMVAPGVVDVTARLAT
jgi:hypothetical protein